MTQLSRPFQIVLVAVVLFALVWFVALRGHSASPTPVAGTPASTPAPATAAKAKAPAGTTHIEGMTRAVTHARDVAAGGRQVRQLIGRSSEPGRERHLVERDGRHAARCHPLEHDGHHQARRRRSEHDGRH